jgi:preprotein translocase subunit SecG
MLTVIVVIHLMLVLAMIGVVLLQRSEGGGLGSGSTGGGFLTSRGTANVLTRTTAFLAAAFFGTSLLMSVLAGWERKPRSILDSGASPATTLPAVPSSAPAPLTQPGGNGVLDQLRKQQQPQPAPPGPPAEPQVPRSQ